MTPRVIAVVVAYNRAELLAQTLEGLRQQTAPVDGVIVVDNASTDNSAEVARQFEVLDIVSMEENLGGAGGFAAGIARAVIQHQADLVWVMDDDTVPTATACAELLKARDLYPGTPAILASKAVWTDGRQHPMNTPRTRPGVSRQLQLNAANAGARQIRSASFVSIMIDRRAILEDGLPEADYFLWNDDFEYTARLLRSRVGLFVPGSVVVHKTKKFGASETDPGPRFFNEVRNKIWMYTRSNSLGPIEKSLYAGRSILRWGQTVLRSPNKPALLRYGMEGLKAGIHAPRTAGEVLADTPVGMDAFRVEARLPLPTSEPPKFSVLMSVYRGDDAHHVRRAITSISVEQELTPDQIVLVRDGHVSHDLQDVIDNVDRLVGDIPVTVVELEKNEGLANALKHGLQACEHDVVARADADDICLPHRFAIQIPLMGNLDLLGAAIAEFDDEENQPGLVRALPISPQEIAKVLPLRDPFNHPTVVIRKSAVEAAGGYNTVTKMEDYWLFARMIHNGARVANVRNVLVLYRTGEGAYDRRGGRSLLDAEMDLQRAMYSSKMTNIWQLVRNIAIRGGYRLLPSWARKVMFHAAMKSSWKR